MLDEIKNGAVKEDLLEKAYKLAEKNEKTCTGCAQSTVAAILDVLEIKSDDTFRAASGLADGIGLTGDGSCGALVGGAMCIGLVSGRERKDFQDPMAAMNSYLLSKKLHDDFIQRYGACRCHDIQKKLMGRTFNLYDEKEMKEAFESGMMDHCSKVVGNSARETVRIIQEEIEKGSL